MERGRWYAYEQVYVNNNVKNQEDGYARSTHNVFVFVGLVDEATDCAELPPFPESSHPRRTQDFMECLETFFSALGVRYV